MSGQLVYSIKTYVSQTHRIQCHGIKYLLFGVSKCNNGSMADSMLRLIRLIQLAKYNICVTLCFMDRWGQTLRHTLINAPQPKHRNKCLRTTKTPTSFLPMDLSICFHLWTPAEEVNRVVNDWNTRNRTLLGRIKMFFVHLNSLHIA